MFEISKNQASQKNSVSKFDMKIITKSPPNAKTIGNYCVNIAILPPDPYKKKFVYKLGKCVIIDMGKKFVVRNAKTNNKIIEGKKMKFVSDYCSGQKWDYICIACNKYSSISYCGDNIVILSTKNPKSEIKFTNPKLNEYYIRLTDPSIPLKCITSRIISRPIINKTVDDAKKILFVEKSIYGSWLNDMTPCHLINMDDINKLEKKMLDDVAKIKNDVRREEENYVVKKIICDLITK